MRKKQKRGGWMRLHICGYVREAYILRFGMLLVIGDSVYFG